MRLTRAEERPPLRVLALLVLLFALGARLVYIAARPVTFRDGVGCFGDSNTYLKLALNLSQHGVFSQAMEPPRAPSAYKPPMYPIFLAAAFRAGIWDLHTIRLLQGVFDSFTALFVFAAAWMLTGRRAESVLAGCLMAICPYGVHYSRALLSEWLGASLFALFLMLAVLALKRRRLGWVVAAAAVMGLAILTRPVMMLFSAIAAAVIAAAWRDAWRRRALAVLVFALTTAAVVGAWSTRNYVALGRRVVVSAGGMSVGLLRGTWETPANWSWNDVPRDAFASEGERREAARLLDLARTASSEGDMPGLADANRAIKSLAAQRWRAAPARCLRLALGRLPLLWWNHSVGMYLDRDPPGIYALAYLAGWLLALPFLCARPNAGAFLVWIVPVYLTVLHLPAHGEPRFTLPAMPALSVAAAIGLASLWRVVTAAVRRGAGRAGIAPEAA